MIILKYLIQYTYINAAYLNFPSLFIFIMSLFAIKSSCALWPACLTRFNRQKEKNSSFWYHLGFFFSYFPPSCLNLDSSFFSQHLPELPHSALGFFTFQVPTFVTHSRQCCCKAQERDFFIFFLLFSFCFECTAITTGYELSSTVIDVFNFLSVSRSLFPSLWPDKRDIHTLIVYVCFTQHS